MEGPRKGGRGETEIMEFGKGKTGTGELPPPTPNPNPTPPPPLQLPMAATAAPAAAAAAAAGVTPPTTNVLMRQTSIGSTNAGSKINNINCLCSPTTHAGSFRCRLHRAPSSSLQRTKSIDSDYSVAATAPPDS